MIYAWPDRKHLQDLWDVEADALVVVEWGEPETAEWIEDANPVRLLPGETIAPSADSTVTDVAPLPNGIDGILEGIAAWAAGYSTGLKWNEEDKLKADMMNRPDRWVDVSVERFVRSAVRLGCGRTTSTPLRSYCSAARTDGDSTLAVPIEIFASTDGSGESKEEDVR